MSHLLLFVIFQRFCFLFSEKPHLLHYGTNPDQEDKCKKITSSTPIKAAESDVLVPCEGDIATKRVLLTDYSSRNKLSSNLAVMIGDISGIDNGVYSDGFLVSPASSALHRNQQAKNVNEKTDTMMPSTLDLSDLDLGSIDSYKEFSIQDKAKRYYPFGFFPFCCYKVDLSLLPVYALRNILKSLLLIFSCQNFLCCRISFSCKHHVEVQEH